jgi:hypothetical protein
MEHLDGENNKKIKIEIFSIKILKKIRILKNSFNKIKNFRIHKMNSFNKKIIHSLLILHLLNQS